MWVSSIPNAMILSGLGVKCGTSKYSCLRSVAPIFQESEQGPCLIGFVVGR